MSNLTAGEFFLKTLTGTTKGPNEEVLALFVVTRTTQYPRRSNGVRAKREAPLVPSHIGSIIDSSQVRCQRE